LPWNFPIWLPFKISLPALVGGNPVLMKNSPSTPQCSEQLQDIFNEAYLNLSYKFHIEVSRTVNSKTCSLITNNAQKPFRIHVFAPSNLWAVPLVGKMSLNSAENP
jgi:Aldehyde dehydrogenase family